MIKNNSILCIDIYKKVILEKWHSKIQWISEEDMYKISRPMTEIEAMICMPYYVTAKLLDYLPNLKWLQFTGSGYDKADFEAVKERNITATNTRDVMSCSIAEDVFAKMLFFTRRFKDNMEAAQQHRWEQFGAHQWMGSVYTDLYGKTLGLIGDGSISKETALRARAFGMKVIAYGRTYKGNPEFDEFVSGKDGLRYLAEKSDFAVCAIPYSKDTYRLINGDFFKRMKKSAVFINIARGAIVNEKELIEALEKDEIAGAGIDVFEKEPLDSKNKIWDAKNLYITFHKAGMGDSWIGNLAELLQENLELFDKGEKLKYVVNERKQAVI